MEQTHHGVVQHSIVGRSRAWQLIAARLAEIGKTTWTEY